MEEEEEMKLVTEGELKRKREGNRGRGSAYIFKKPQIVLIVVVSKVKRSVAVI